MLLDPQTAKSRFHSGTLQLVRSAWRRSHIALLSKWLASLGSARTRPGIQRPGPRVVPAVEGAAIQMSKTTTTPAADSIAVDDLSAQLDLLRWVEDQLDGLKRFRADVQRAVKLRLGDVEVGTVNCVPVVSYRKALRITLSPRLVRELDPDLARRCEEISEVRTFLLLDAA